jgi:hypothetical protein
MRAEDIILAIPLPELSLPTHRWIKELDKTMNCVYPAVE